MTKDIAAVPFRDMESGCEFKFISGVPYWHLFTDGNKADMIFSCEEEFKAGINMLGVCCLRSPHIKVYTFELMNNHMHMILSGDKDGCRRLFADFRVMLKRYFIRNGKAVVLKDFNCSMIEITSLQSLRNEIVYVNRNGFVTRPDCTPYSYPWGAGACFFNPFLKHLPHKPYNSLTVRAKREICHSNDTTLEADDVKVFEGVLLPSSFCHIEEAEAIFRNAHHYFQLLTRKFEAYSEIARTLHEKVFISDEEMYQAVCALCIKEHNVKNPSHLNSKDRITMARRMRQEYNASNRQIKNILKLDKTIIDELFPI